MSICFHLHHNLFFSAITVTPKCQVRLKSHIIQPDSATTDSDLDKIHYEWSWYSNFLYTTFHIFKYDSTLFHLKNLTAIWIANINEEAASALANSESEI
jgi:hypothetical protein